MRSHTTERGCVVTVRAVGPSVEIVVRQSPEHKTWCATRMLRSDGKRGTCGCNAGSVATYACSHDDAVAIGTMIIAACPRPSEGGTDG